MSAIDSCGNIAGNAFCARFTQWVFAVNTHWLTLSSVGMPAGCSIQTVRGIGGGTPGQSVLDNSFVEADRTEVLKKNRDNTQEWAAAATTVP